MFERIARVCPTPECGYRRFFESQADADVWRCPDHHKAVVQANRPYMGKEVLKALAEAALAKQ